MCTQVMASASPAFRPRTFAKLAANQRAGYEKAIRNLRYNLDVNNIYQHADLRKAKAFLPLSCDEEAAEFLAQCWEQVSY